MFNRVILFDAVVDVLTAYNYSEGQLLIKKLKATKCLLPPIKRLLERRYRGTQETKNVSSTVFQEFFVNGEFLRDIQELL